MQIINESLVIALAFFACIFLIVKFSGKKFVEFLRNKGNIICNFIDKKENELGLLKTQELDLLNQEHDINHEIINLLKEADKEKKYLITEAEKNAEIILNKKIDHQKKLNEIMKKDAYIKINEIAFKNAINVLKDSLINNGEIDEKIHKNLIDKILDDVNLELSSDKNS